jgi:hypothetical protein
MKKKQIDVAAATAITALGVIQSQRSLKAKPAAAVSHFNLEYGL